MCIQSPCAVCWLSLQQAPLGSVAVNIVGNWLEDLWCHRASRLVIWSPLNWVGWSGRIWPVRRCQNATPLSFIGHANTVDGCLILVALAVSLARLCQLNLVLTSSRSVLRCSRCSYTSVGHAVGVNMAQKSRICTLSVTRKGLLWWSSTIISKFISPTIALCPLGKTKGRRHTWCIQILARVFILKKCITNISLQSQKHKPKHS